MLDKERTHELAVEHGIPVPRTMPVRDADELAAAAEADRLTRRAEAASRRTSSAATSRSRDSSASTAPSSSARFAETEAAGVEMLVTEMVPGPDRYHSIVHLPRRATATSLFTFTKQKLRQYPIRFGGGCYHIMDWDPEVSELGLRFCQAVGLRGFLNVEFKRDERDGELKLIECNHRFTASTALHLAAGLNVPLFTYNHLLGIDAARVGPPVQREHRALVPARRLPRVQGLPAARRDDVRQYVKQPDAPASTSRWRASRTRGR